MDAITEKALNIIGSHPQGMFQCDLWKILMIDNKACSRALDQLTADNYIQRVDVNGNGKRTKLITLKISPEQIPEIISAHRDNNDGHGFEKLIRDHRLVVKGHVIKSSDIAEIKNYRILARPLGEILINDLKSGNYSNRNLADKHNITLRDIQNEIELLIRHPYLPGEGFLIGRSGHRTPAKSTGSEYIYTIIPIPLKARIFDPFLGFSLLEWPDYVTQPENKPEPVPDREMIAEYTETIHFFSGIPSEEIEAVLDKNSFFFINSLFGPVPVLTPVAAYREIFESVPGWDDLTLQVPLSDKKMELKIQEIRRLIENEPPDIPTVHQYVIVLADMLRFCKKHSKNEYLDELESLNKKFFTTMFPAISPVGEVLKNSQDFFQPTVELPVSIRGSDNRHLIFKVPSDTVTISGEYLGSERFSVSLKTRATTSPVVSADTRKTFSETVPTKNGEVYSLDIRAAGPWSVRVTTPSLESARSLPLHITGRNNRITDLFLLTEGKKTILVNYFNAGRMVIRIKNSAGAVIFRVLDNIGPLERTVVINNDWLRICSLDIYAQGTWEITVEDENIPSVEPGT